MDLHNRPESIQHTKTIAEDNIGHQKINIPALPVQADTLEVVPGVTPVGPDLDPAPIQPEDTRDRSLLSFEAELDALLSELELERALSKLEDTMERPATRLPGVADSQAVETVHSPLARTMEPVVEEQNVIKRDIFTTAVDTPLPATNGFGRVTPPIPDTPWPPGSELPTFLDTPLPAVNGRVVGTTVEATPVPEAETAAYDLTVVIPTRNERDNIVPLLDALREALDGMGAEVIFVDDSDDDTPLIIEDASVALGTPAFHVRLDHRQPGVARAGGLATAVVRGMGIAQAEHVAVIDADLQHPPALLRALYDRAAAQDVDVVLVSRYLKEGSNNGLAGVGRRFISLCFKRAAKILFPRQLQHVSDPLSGFFLLRRSLLNGVILRPTGYKILLEILLKCPWQELVEVPYHFQRRRSGKSKSNFRQGLKTLQHMARLFKEVPAAGRVWKVGALLLFNLAALAALFFLYPFTVSFWQPLSGAVFVLVTALNFLLLNRYISPPSPGQEQPASPPAPIDRALAPAIADSCSTTMVLNPKVPPQTRRRLPVSSQAVPAPQRVKRAFGRDKLFMWISLLLALTTAVMVGYAALDLTPYAIPNAWVILVAVLFGLNISIATSGKKNDFHRIITMLLAISMVIAFVNYLSWRVEVINWSGLWLAVPLLFAEVLGGVHILGLQFTLWPRPQPRVQPGSNPTHAPIFVFIPTVDEGVSILEPTIRGALAARDRYLASYPWGQVDIVICNDGFVAAAPGWQAIEALANKMGVQCITRKQPGGAKAGNIENARQLVGATDDALIVIFDADQVAKADFLLKTVPNLADPRIGWVQTGQYYRNLDNPVARWADDQQSMFYNLLCPGKATWNAAFICGTNVVIRAQALDEIGGLPQDSVTEDFAASITLHERWRSIYLTDILATGLGPMDLSAYLKQQRRWANGTLGVLRTHWRDIFLPRKNGLRLGQRLQYFLACTHYLCGLRDLLYLLCPILFVFSGVPAVQGSTLSAFLLHFLPYFLVSFATIWYAGRGITGLRGIVMGFGSFPVLIESLIAVVLHRKVGFAVTSKKRGARSSARYFWIYLFFVALCLAALIYSTRVRARVYSALVISLLWIAYTLFMLCGFLWLYFLDWRKRRAERRAGTHVQPERYVYPARLPLRERGLRSARNLGLALALAAFLLLTGMFHSPFPPASAYPLLPGSRPFLGVDLPAALLKQRPAQLERELGADFAIVGRTQDVNDSFDVAWADNLAAHHARPWIDLQFGVFGANGKPPDDASLLAIAHGLRDGALTRWAQAIRAYGKPVFLTILLHVDRNWSLSSAVANGGIPEDVAPAWLHVESLFKQAGADNVSWLWEPADPIHDQPYAPPAASIDGVVLDLISYPNTTWGDPEAVVGALMDRYPGKPIIMHVSAAGPADQKAAWLAKVGATAESTRAVYALIYHDASPSLSPDPELDKQWSMTSDPESLAVMRQIAAQL